VNVKSVLRKIKGRIKKLSPLPPDEERQIAVLPTEGAAVSLEKALNSRCSSDYDNDTSIGHWGMFDKTKKLSLDQIQTIVSSAKVPRFTEYKCEIRSEKNLLFFIADPKAQGTDRDCLMIESGMQQQAVSLICAAMGVGTLLKNVGPGGKQLSDTDFCTITMRIDPMKPSYNGSFWTTAAPEKECAWKQGNLPNPQRNGATQLLSAFENVSMEKTGSGKTLTSENLSQVLWAAKGRTSHFYKSIPWGMTIPTWNGAVEVTSVYVCNEQGLYKYINWERNRPTHSIQKIVESGTPIFKKLLADFQGRQTFLLFKNNFSYAASLWEIGYSLIGALLQISSIQIPYTVSIVTKNNRGKHTLDLIGQTPVILGI
jgi:hypothetical protein